MMTSVGGERTRGARDKGQISATQPTQPQKPVVQATAEQIRLAQMIYDKNDADFEDKVKQLMEVTGKNQDDCIVALHDCNGDVNRAINILLEGNSDTTSWETVGGKKKTLGKESSENKENREKRVDRDVMIRGQGISNRRGGRGGSRGREFRAEENGVDSSPGDRPSDRGKRGRGRGFGRGRGRGIGRFSSQSMGTFNPADYTETPAMDGYGTKLESWEPGQNDATDGTGTWKNSIEEWTTEDWNEDLSETKVFTASSIPVENHITPGQSIDLMTLLQKPVTSSSETEANSFETSQQQGFGQALVFTNSQHNSQMSLGAGSTNTVNAYSPQSLSSVLCSEFGSSKLANSSGSQILEQLKSPSVGQFASPGSLSTSAPVSTTAVSSWDVKPTISQSSVLSQFDFKSQPEPSPVLSQLTQRQRQQQQQQTAAAAPAPPPGLESFAPQVKVRERSPVESSTAVGKMLQLSSLSTDTQVSPVQQMQQKQIKLPKRRIPPASKIPASAVEMPGSADLSELNVQFGALEFGLEPAFSDGGPAANYENTNQTPSEVLYPKLVTEPSNTSLPVSATVQESPNTTPAISSASLSCSSQSTSPVTTTSSFDQTSVHSRITYQSSTSPSEPPPAGVMNGHGSVRTQPTHDTTSSVPAPKTEASPPSLPTKVSSLPSTTATTASFLPSTPLHTVPLPNLPQSNDLANCSLSQLSSSHSNNQSSLSSASAPSSTSHIHASVENSTALQPSASFSIASTSAISATSSVSSMANTTNSLGLNVTSVCLPAPTTRAAPLVSSGKAPPNLPQGVPPLLHNQYIVGPGGLLPAYPIYGYDDLQVLQSRLPMDYYGITFPAPATLTGREGNLGNNPYSGDITKFSRGDSASPTPATTLAQAQQNQTQTHHATQQPFLNTTLPPGYGYASLPYYAGVSGVPSAFQYGPTMFVPPASAKQHSLSLSTASSPFQQPSGYSQHGYGAGYDDVTQGTGAGDYGKGGYAGSSQAQNKASGSGPGKGVSVTSSNTGVPDITGSVYNKTQVSLFSSAQTFDKQGFHAGTPPPFSLPSALGSTGPLNPGAASGYAPAPFLHILPAHQQPHAQLLHHHLQQDGQGGSGQRSQPSVMQQKSQATKTAYGTSPYWTN